MNFRVGQKVVCIDTTGAHPGSALRLNGVYTVRKVFRSRLGNLGLELFETKPFASWYLGFRADRFRPAVERKTDISIFTKMLTDKRVSEPV